MTASNDGILVPLDPGHPMTWQAISARPYEEEHREEPVAVDPEPEPEPVAETEPEPVVEAQAEVVDTEAEPEASQPEVAEAETDAVAVGPADAARHVIKHNSTSRLFN